jgi:hypothetical protein
MAIYSATVYLVLATGSLSGQIDETNETTSSSFTQLLNPTLVSRQGEQYRTRVVGRIDGGRTVYDRTFELPPEAVEVTAATLAARNELRVLPEVITVRNPVRQGPLTTAEVSSATVRTQVTKTIGVTRRETIGPATTHVGAFATEANPCARYSGGSPLGTGGLTPGDGFQFHFTTPLQVFGCPLAGTLVTVPGGSRNIDTLTHIHTDIYETTTTTRTTAIANTFEIVATTESEPSPPAQDIGMLVRYVSNLDRGDATIWATNSGARGAGLFSGFSANTTGSICLNVYTFTQDDQLASCCSCVVTPNGLASLSAKADFLSNTPISPVPQTLLVKLLATTPVGGTCNNSALNPGPISPGLHAWATTVVSTDEHVDINQSDFLRTSSPSGEREGLAARCTAFVATGAGFNICRSCRLGSASFFPRP